jgi:hypothetical protein
MTQQTEISIDGDSFRINGELTYKDRYWNGNRIEGLLLNSRMVQGIFDDLNEETRHQWAYEDTGVWDADRNTNEFVEAMPTWLDHGILAFTINLQGGSPYGYSKAQPWINSAMNPDGSLRNDYMGRLERIINRADELGMVVILGIFYFGQEKVLEDADAIKNSVDNTIDWLFEHDYRNVLVEINNECNVHYEQPLLTPEGVHELILRAKERQKNGRRFLVGTSYGGRTIPKPNVVEASDFLLLHGNGVGDPAKISDMVRQTREVEGYRPMPILFNEDDHFNFDKPMNNFVAAISEYASWGFFDYRLEGETAQTEGYQSVPVTWDISSDRKKGFFNLAKDIAQG